jgi:hypothetical protein
MNKAPNSSSSAVPPATPRRVVGVALVRAAATVALFVLAYYLLPFGTLSDAKSVVVLVFGLLGVTLIVVWEVRSILNAQYPAIKAIEALAMIAPLFLLLFSAAYYLLERATATSFSQPLSRTDALYFTVTTFSTVGYGDITAKSQGARVMVIFQMLADLIILGLGVKVIFGAVQIGRQRQTAGPGHGPPSSPTSAATTPIDGMPPINDQNVETLNATPNRASPAGAEPRGAGDPHRLRTDCHSHSDRPRRP